MDNLLQAANIIAKAIVDAGGDIAGAIFAGLCFIAAAIFFS